MQIFETIRIIERINQLFRLKATGSPSELAAKLNICERQVYRIIEDFKDAGLPIQYCKKRKTYFYTHEVFMKFEISVLDTEEKKRIVGGEAKKYCFNDIFFQTDILRQFPY